MAQSLGDSEYDKLMRTIGAMEALMAEADAGRRLMLYGKQCKELVEEFKDMRESLLSKGPPGDESTPVLRELFRVACDAKTVVESCSCEDQTSWLQAALIQNDRTIFKSILDDLRRNFESRRDRDIVLSFDEDHKLLGRELQRIKEDNNVPELEKVIATFLHARFTKEEEWEYFAERDIVCDEPWDRIEPNNNSLGEEGTFGKVQAIRWFGIKLAKKNLFSKMSSDILYEMSTMAMLHHHNVVKFISSSRDMESPAIIMECMEMTLAEYLQERGRQNFLARGAHGPSVGLNSHPAPFDRASPDQIMIAVDIMYQIASGMEYLHDKPHEVAHRDLKSDNILINECKDDFKRYVHVKIADFGLSKRGIKDDNLRRNSRANCGTTLYRAPEMYKKGKFVCPKKADVYAFGIICWEILHGQLPLLKDVKVSEYYGHVVKQGKRLEFDESLDQCPDLKYLENLIKECWHKDPNRRPPFSTCCLALQSYKAMVLGSGKESLLDFREPTETFEGRIKRLLRILILHARQLTH